MKNRKIFKMFCGIVIVLGIMFVFKGVKVYSQGVEDNYKNLVDKDMTLVHNSKEYIEFSGKERQGVTGYIIYLKEGENIIKAMPYINKLASNGYNVYIVKNKSYTELEKVKIGKNIVKRGKVNLNWIINSRDDENYVFELKEWMINGGYRAGIISGYINSFEDMSKNKDFSSLNNELNTIRNKI